MEHLNSNFDQILENKMQEIKDQLLQKKQNKKMIDKQESPEISYHAKTTLYKIQIEQERKKKASKAYQKEEQIFDS